MRRESLAATKIEAGKFLAQCGQCGRWREVSPTEQRSNDYFEIWEAEFRCCERNQTAIFTQEKDYLDFH
jgi:hypothetical protein